MKLSVFSTCLNELTWPEMLIWLAQHEVHHLELGCGAYTGTQHADVHRLQQNRPYRQQMLADLHALDISVAALSCHGNPLHPDPHIAQSHHADLIASLQAAHAMQVPVVVCFSGQPGASLSGSHQAGQGVGPFCPNWPVLAWPEEYAELRSQQWAQSIIPYWQSVAQQAQALGVKIALEMHGGFAVYNPATALQLREACGPSIGVNLDPSHLWWQQIDPVLAVEILGDAIFHVHLKDAVVNPLALARHGVLDTTCYARAEDRAWRFGIPGEGHDATFWRAFRDGLTACEYRGVMSVEYESLLPPLQGVAQTLRYMRAL
jgi:sugar phosphate isomerase/epimerase